MRPRTSDGAVWVATAAPAGAGPSKASSSGTGKGFAGNIRLSAQRSTAPPKPSVVGTAPPQPPPSRPAPFFDGAFSAGWPGWHVQSLPNRISLNPAGPFLGQTATRFEVGTGDVEPETGMQRSELSGPTFTNGEEIVVRDAVRVPRTDTFSGSWMLIDQLHETEWGGSPGIAVFLGEDRHLSLSSGDGDPAFWRGPVLEFERWYELVYRVKLSREPSQGFVEVWLNGAPQTLNNGQARQYGQTIQTEHTYLKVGIFRSASSVGTSVVEHSGVAVSHSVASFIGS